jgi:hypothetical protein
MSLYALQAADLLLTNSCLLDGKRKALANQARIAAKLKLRWKNAPPLPASPSPRFQPLELHVQLPRISR